MAKLREGNSAPDFTLQDQNGQNHSLADYKGQWVLIYFYPKDDTPGCTKEACDIRDNFQAFKDAELIVFGISADSVKNHKKFEQKHKLPFTLLADTDKKVVDLYGVWAKKKFMGREYMGILRTSFLINPNGKITKIFENVKPNEHAKQILTEIDSLSS